MSSDKIKGYLLAAMAAATYGTNPAFAVPLYAEGMNPGSVLIFRYGLSLLMLAVMAAARGRSLRLKRGEAAPLAVLGVLMAASSLCLFEAYGYMDSGVASTMLFVYPVMVAVLMVFFYHERFTATTGLCLLLMLAGLGLLMRSDANAEISTLGICMVMLSSLTYALYLVMINVSRTVRGIPTLKLLFYVLLFGSCFFAFILAAGTPFTMPPSRPGAWLNLLGVAFFPTVLSLLFTTRAIQLIGSTPTAIFGAFEPLTAVLLSVVVLHESLTPREMLGGVLILCAATLVIAGDSFSAVLLRVRKMFPSLRK